MITSYIRNPQELFGQLKFSLGIERTMESNCQVEEQNVVPIPGRQKQLKSHLFQHLVGVLGSARDNDEGGEVHMDCNHNYDKTS